MTEEEGGNRRTYLLRIAPIYSNIRLFIALSNDVSQYKWGVTIKVSDYDCSYI